MKLIYTVIFMVFTALAIGQKCEVPDAIQTSEKMKVLVFQQTENQNNRDYIISFKVPEKSDEVLESSELDCEGWMPKRAVIEKIIIKGVEGIPWGSVWTCNEGNCSWAGGAQGCINLKMSQKIEDDIKAYVDIEGLGSWHGISRWYECKLELIIPAP